MKEPTEFSKFDAATDKILSVSREELKRREAKWKKHRQRKREKRVKA